MKKLSAIIIILLVATSCYAYTVSSNELIERAKDLDGRDVVYKGELVTSILKRGDHAWINLNDGDNAIGVWCREDLLNEIKFVGDYKHNGDVIKVAGVFNRACGKHGGSLDIHAYSVEVVKEGSQRREKYDKKVSYLAIAFFMLTAFIMVRYGRRV